MDGSESRISLGIQWRTKIQCTEFQKRHRPSISSSKSTQRQSPLFASKWRSQSSWILFLQYPIHWFRHTSVLVSSRYLYWGKLLRNWSRTLFNDRVTKYRQAIVLLSHDVECRPPKPTCIGFLSRLGCGNEWIDQQLDTHAIISMNSQHPYQHRRRHHCSMKRVGRIGSRLSLVSICR